MFVLASSIIIFLLLLSFLVVIHELGHYLVAKYFGVRVDEFGIGLPPKAKKLFTYDKTDFTLNWLPLGGFVKLAGEERTAEEKIAALKTGDTDDLFFTKPAWPRIAVLAAGPAVNFAFGIIAFAAMFTFMGVPQLVPLDQGVFVTAVMSNSPAEEAGIMLEDIILALVIDDNQQVITNTEDFVNLLTSQAGNTVELSIKRGDQTISTPVYVRTSDEVPAGEGAVGIGISSDRVDFVLGPWWQRPFLGAWHGMISAVDFGQLILESLGGMVTNLFAGRVPSEVSGPIGIVHVAYKQNLFGDGWLSSLNFAAILSINLAIINLLPIPALDGGRILFVLIEKLFGRNLKPGFEQNANLIGFALLLSLIALISLKDIGTIIGDLGGLSRIKFW